MATQEEFLETIAHTEGAEQYYAMSMFADWLDDNGKATSAMSLRMQISQWFPDLEWLKAEEAAASGNPDILNGLWEKRQRRYSVSGWFIYGEGI